MKSLPLLLILISLSASHSVHAAVAVTTLNVPVINTFDALPAATEFSTLAALDSAGGQAAVTTAAGLDAAVNANASVAASALTSPLISSASWPTTQNSSGRYNTGANTGAGNGGFLQFRATGSAYVATMATLVNSTGSPITSLTIGYDYSTSTAMTADEDIDGLRAYFSLSGGAGTWMNIPALSSDATVTTGSISAPQAVSTTLDLSATPWTAGTNFYLLWVDDNGPPAADAQNAGNERSYHIDNLSLTGAVPEPSSLLLGLSLAGLLVRRRR